MAVAVPIIMYATAAMAAYGAIQQGKAQQAAATFNAITAMQDETMAKGEALLQAQQTHRETVLRLGKARAAQGASGGTAEGSFLDVVGDIAKQGELERQYQLWKGEAKARGYRNTAELDLAQGESAREASYIGAGSELLGGGARATEALRRVG
jgi:hypothetical protein